jgi:hypothetical protein
MASTLAMPKRGFDQRLERHAPGLAVGLLDLVDHCLDHVEIGRNAYLGHQERVDLVAGLFHHVDHVAIHVVRIEPVDPHRDRLALAGPVDVVERRDGVLARLYLFGRRDGVLEVEKDEIRAAVGGFFDHRGVRRGHGEFRSLQALRAQRVKRVGHIGSF